MSFFEDPEEFYDIDLGNIPEIDCSRFQEYIDFHQEVNINFLKMKEIINSLSTKLDEAKFFSAESVKWNLFWKYKYKDAELTILKLKHEIANLKLKQENLKEEIKNFKII